MHPRSRSRNPVSRSGYRACYTHNRFRFGGGVAARAACGARPHICRVALVRPRSTGRRRPRNPAPQSVADLLPQVVARLGGDDRALEQKVSLAWPEAVGDLLSRRARPESVRGKTLIVRVSSSAFAHELTLLKGEILERLRRVVGDGLLDDMRTRVGPLSG